MLNMAEIEDTIQVLENDTTTLDSVHKLASLYIVRQMNKDGLFGAITTSEDITEHELNDILPEYRRYVDIKKRFQLGQTAKESVLHSMKDVCQEIYEFMETLYRCTDMPEEREQIKEMVDRLRSI